MADKKTTTLAYFDETGDDGRVNSPSDIFVLTSLCIPSNKWQDNFNKIKEFRRSLKQRYGFHISQEMHTKKFVQNKNPYHDYNWSDEIRREIIKEYSILIASLDISVINVIIDKTKINREDYHILETALTYNIQRIENNSADDWNYIIITDRGRIAPMKKTARRIRAYNPIESMYNYSKRNKPILNMVEDIFEKDSKESYFIQICDFISYFVFLFYRTKELKMPLKSRIANVMDIDRIENLMHYFGKNIFNLKANHNNEFGFVVYPK